MIVLMVVLILAMIAIMVVSTVAVMVALPVVLRITTKDMNRGRKGICSKNNNKNNKGGGVDDSTNDDYEDVNKITTSPSPPPRRTNRTNIGSVFDNDEEINYSGINRAENLVDDCNCDVDVIEDSVIVVILLTSS